MVCRCVSSTLWPWRLEKSSLQPERREAPAAAGESSGFLAGWHTQIKVRQEHRLPQVPSRPFLHSVGEPSTLGFESDEPLSLFISPVLAAWHRKLVATARVDHCGQQGSIRRLEGLMQQREPDSSSTELDARDRCGNHLAVRRRRTEAPSEEAVEGRHSGGGFLFFCCDVVKPATGRVRTNPLWFIPKSK
jgi:hypothetical protein